VNRKAARSCGRNAAERNAVVIDRFFDTKQKALAWAKANPHFMEVQVCHLTPRLAPRRDDVSALATKPACGLSLWTYARVPSLQRRVFTRHSAAGIFVVAVR
jgi:hypothetical protein